ncbi:hypothetical protein ZIOFF_033298 [Zingiber officinale]|uniref:dUTP diphosphatase n=1 Tax=Zingiber officinale TaxID=94328 RepID=A0A8J5GWU4_ZINOF|nr:hypothetical protein ZIOFF_033298 [Zingiber officinale]
MVGRLSNTPNVGFAYEVQGVVDYLTSHGVKALPRRSFFTRSLQGLNWVINPTQAIIPMQPAEVNSRTMVDGRISLSFSNYTAAQSSEEPKYNNKDEEVFETLAVLIESKPGVFTNFDGTAEEYENLKGKRKEKFKTGRWDTLGQPSSKFDYYVNYDIPQIPSNLQLLPLSWGDEEENDPNTPDKSEKREQETTTEDRYSSSYEPHILVHKISSMAVIPERQTAGFAGLDIAASHAAVIEPYGRDLIHTGLQIEIPYGYYGQLASRSGLAWRSGIEVGAGVIDSNYRGEVQVLLFNRTNLPVYISPQQRIAQLILKKIAYPEVYEVPHLSYTERSNKGFGSTDIIQPNEASKSPLHFTKEDIFALLMPRERLAVLVQEESLQNSCEQIHAANTSPGASVPRSMEPTPDCKDDDDSDFAYIQYLASLSTQIAPVWDDYSESEWTNPFASKGGGKEEFLELIPSNCKEFIELIAANFLSPTKMKIAVKEIEFLGAIIGNCKIKLQPHVISKIADFNDNDFKTTKGMRSWLGLLNYARNYIPNLGKLLSPLYAKTSPNGEKRLNQQDWDLIHQVKEKVKQLPDLEIPSPVCYVILEVDGCMDGWGGICKWKKQKFDPISSEKICAYFSGKFNPSKSIINVEIYAVIKKLTDGGADFSFECIGDTDIVSTALQSCCDGWGVTVTLGVPKTKPEVSTHYAFLLTGRTLKGSLFGGWKPKSDLPSLVDKYSNGVGF